MKRLYLYTFILLALVSFLACGKKQTDDTKPDDNKSSVSVNEPTRDLRDDETLSDDGYNKLNDSFVNNNPDETSADEEVKDLRTYYVIGDSVRMREDASLEASILDLLSKGTKVEYIDRKGEWIKVSFNDKIGYIRNDLLSLTEPIEVTGDKPIKVAVDEPIAEAGDKTKEKTGDEGMVEAGSSIEDIDNPKIIIKKADRVLQLWDGDTLRATYPIGLGWNPIGDKEKEGDGRTPEGTYYICTRNNYSRFYLSLGLSYPNREDAKKGLEAGLINQNTYNQIGDAIDRGIQPPWNTALGGEIMIHGHGSQTDWTAGCVAVDNDIMDILWEHCGLGTRVIIEP